MWEEFFRDLSQASEADLSPDSSTGQRALNTPKKILQPTKANAPGSESGQRHQDSHRIQRDSRDEGMQVGCGRSTLHCKLDERQPFRQGGFLPHKGCKDRSGLENQKEEKKSRKKQNERGMKMIEGKWRFPEEMKHHLQFWNPMVKGSWFSHPLSWYHQFVPFFKHKARPLDLRRGNWGFNHRFPKKNFFPRFPCSPRRDDHHSLRPRPPPKEPLADSPREAQDEASTPRAFPPISKQAPGSPEKTPDSPEIERLMEAQILPTKSFKNQRYENLMKKFLPPHDDPADLDTNDRSSLKGRKAARVKGPQGEVMHIEVEDEDDDLCWSQSSYDLSWNGRAERGMIYQNGHWKYHIK